MPTGAVVPLLVSALMLASAVATEECAAPAADEACALQVPRRSLSSNAGPPQPIAVEMRKLWRHQRRPGAGGQGSSGQLVGAAFADYSATVTIDGVPFQAIVDTGSAIFAVAAHAGQGCERYYGGPCTGANVSVQYGVGEWSGRTCSGAHVTLAGADAGRPRFVGIMRQQDFLTECTADAHGIVSQGIVGMAYPALGLGIKPLFDSVVEATGLANVFCIQCCGWTGHGRAHGQISLGGVDRALYTGKLQYTPITQELYFCVEMLTVGTATPSAAAGPPPPDDCKAIPGATCAVGGCHRSRGEGVLCKSGRCWCPPGTCASGGRCAPLSMLRASATAAAPQEPLGRLRQLGALSVSGDSVRYSRYKGAHSGGRCGTIIDSGTSELIFNDSIYWRVMEQIMEVANHLPSWLQCITAEVLPRFPDIVLEFGGGATVHVPPNTYFQPTEGSDCMVVFIGTAAGVPNILGLPLMESHYTVFDREKGRVGFAPIAGCD